MADGSARPGSPTIAARVQAAGLGLTRRRLLSAGVGLGAALLLPAPPNRVAQGSAEPVSLKGLFQAYCPLAPLHTRLIEAAPPIDGSSPLLVEPEVRPSVGGLLSTNLRLQYAYADIGGYRLSLRTYEGTVPGPTLRVRPGDVLKITLINDLPPNRDIEPAHLNHPHHFNTTNFHFHGSHVSPSGISDNILREMEPGQSYDIEIAIPPDHTRGMYWYHPHHHGSADIQVASGMAGAIIVEGNFDDVPEIAAARERVLIVSESVFDDLRTVEDFDTLFPETATRFLTINGQRTPTIQLRPGEVQRWRMLHAGYQDDVLLTLDGHKLHPLAYDGIDLSTMESADTILLAPGQRVEFLVKAGAPGLYEMHALPNDQGYPSPTGPLAHVVVDGDPLPMGLPAALPQAPLAGISNAELTGSREVVFSAITPENDAAGHYQEFSFLVDGKLFDEDRVDHSIALGSVEEWTLTNLHAHDHIFHIHTNPFEVTKVNGQALASPVWRDTVVLPGNGSLTFRSRFLDFTGRYVLHCHMMNHEDMGMMQLIEVH